MSGLMSVVTNLIFACSNLEQSPVERVNAFFGNAPGFEPVDGGGVGGTKRLETLVAIGAFNYLKLGALVDYIRQLEWKEPECVQLFAKEQEERRFRTIQPSETQLGSLLGETYEGHVVQSRGELCFRACGAYGYRPIPKAGFDELNWKDRVRVRVVAVDHLKKEMLVDVLG